ncbi:4-coumarate--CoA ligase [Aquabacterium sp.]|uniref:4-coumarate--CoA ligase n=1 Tax=Aquabacterium sp. TaxID=1872578 RepID=UPI0019880C12|nr:4-coumarate--CoA ligase [Aquabacterium sp.]MBC7700722.1 4-coumarate--CoA ligase [Aquabacterium sp.]
MPVDLTQAEPLSWHRRQSALARFVADLVAHELSHLRPGGVQLPERPWPSELAIDEQGLGLDSLERLSIASALSEALHLHESGIEDLLLARRRFGQWLEVAAEGLAAFDARLTFRTSGSSGVAKACPHELANLLQEVEHLASLVPHTRRVLAAVPAHHIYGFLFTVLLPDRLGCNEVLDIRMMTPAVVASFLQPGDLVVSHPAHWSILARHAVRLPHGVQGITSTAPCPDLLARRLEDLGLATLTQVYGSSETAGIGTRTAAGAPFRLMPYWSRDPQVEPRLMRAGKDGSICPHGIQDRLEWMDDRQFRVCGRLDEAVQVGGNNVFPSRVRQVLLDHPQVSDVVVRMMTAEEGSRLKAFVVPTPGTDPTALRADLWRWSESHLSAPERPKAFKIGDELPRNVMGKLSDWPLDVAHNAAQL